MRSAPTARRVVAVACLLAVLVGLVFAVRGCIEAGTERALKDYASEVAALTQESDEQGKSLFDLLRDPRGRTPVDVQNSANSLRVEADQLVDRARRVDYPDEMAGAHRFLVDTLEFRRDGVGEIARELPTALGDEGRGPASARIAAQMPSFFVSDVIYSRRVVPGLRAPLTDKRLLDEAEVPNSRFLPELSWLERETVAGRLGELRAGSGDKAAAPGLHGTGLGQVTVRPSNQMLVKGQPVEIKAREDLALSVAVQNQGESAEQDVTVRVSITRGGEPLELEEQVDTLPAGALRAVTIPLATTPPLDRPLGLQLEVEPVPGERKTDNNRATFQATFIR